MTMLTISVLEALEATTKRLEKEAILRENVKNDLLRRTLIATLDPYVNYGLRKCKPSKGIKTVYSTGPDEDDFLYEWLEFLSNDLATRKLSGNAAKAKAQQLIDEAVAFSPRLGVWFERILLKNLRVGAQEKTVNKIWPGSVVGFEVQLANTLDAIVTPEGVQLNGSVQYPCASEPKLDGLRLIAIKKNGVVTLSTRNGTQLDTLPELVRDLEACTLDNFVLDGEGCAAGDQSIAWNESASVMMSSKNHKDASNIKYNVFDCMSLNDWVQQKCELTHSSRRRNLINIVKTIPGDIVQLVPQEIVNSDEELLTLYEKFLDGGYEGCMIKTLNGKYEFKRTDAMRKLKPVATYEGVVIDTYDGKLGTKREHLFGGFTVLLPNGVATNVGSGFTDVLKKQIHDEGQHNYIGKIVEVEGQPPLTSEGKIRFPRLVRFRDKSDVDPRVMEAFETYMENKS